MSFLVQPKLGRSMLSCCFPINNDRVRGRHCNCVTPAAPTFEGCGGYVYMSPISYDGAACALTPPEPTQRHSQMQWQRLPHTP